MHLLLGRAAIGADLPVDHLGERPERDLLLERARTAREHADALGQAGEELLDHARLADAGLAEQRHEVRPLAHAHPLERVGEQRQLAPAVHERDRPARLRPDDAERPATPAIAASKPFASIMPALAELDRVADEQAGALADEHLPRPRRLLQTGADVHLGADHDVAVGRRAHRDRPGVHADPHADRHRQLEPGTDARRPLHDREAGAHAALGVVVVQHRHAEHTQHRVADEALGTPAQRRDLVGHHAVERGEHVAEPLGIERSRRARSIPRGRRRPP